MRNLETVQGRRARPDPLGSRLRPRNSRRPTYGDELRAAEPQGRVAPTERGGHTGATRDGGVRLLPTDPHRPQPHQRRRRPRPAALPRVCRARAESSRRSGGRLLSGASSRHSRRRSPAAFATGAGRSSPQIGVSSFRIDLGVVHPDRPGDYLVGVECDGATYHRAATARDRDKVREQVLEGLGWALERVWSTDWWIDAADALDRLDLRALRSPGGLSHQGGRRRRARGRSAGAGSCRRLELECGRRHGLDAIQTQLVAAARR